MREKFKNPYKYPHGLPSLGCSFTRGRSGCHPNRTTGTRGTMGQPPPAYRAPVATDPPAGQRSTPSPVPRLHPSEWARLQAPEAGAAGYTLLYRGNFGRSRCPASVAICLKCFVLFFIFILSYLFTICKFFAISFNFFPKIFCSVIYLYYICSVKEKQTEPGGFPKKQIFKIMTLKDFFPAGLIATILALFVGAILIRFGVNVYVASCYPLVIAVLSVLHMFRDEDYQI